MHNTNHMEQEFNSFQDFNFKQPQNHSSIIFPLSKQKHEQQHFCVDHLTIDQCISEPPVAEQLNIPLKNIPSVKQETSFYNSTPPKPLQPPFNILSKQSSVSSPPSPCRTPPKPSWAPFPFKYRPAASFSDNSDVDYSDDDETVNDLLKKLQVKYNIE